MAATIILEVLISLFSVFGDLGVLKTKDAY